MPAPDRRNGASLTLTDVSTVEVLAESLEEQGLYVGEVVASALSRFAAKNPKLIATIYTYGTISVNFHEHVRELLTFRAGRTHGSPAATARL